MIGSPPNVDLNAFEMLIVQQTRPVEIKNVLTHAPVCVAEMHIAMYEITSQFVFVRTALLVMHFQTAIDRQLLNVQLK